MDLVDPYGRTVRDLRISITDRCNFRCTYCMPEEGMQWLPREDILSVRGDRAPGAGVRRALRRRRHPSDGRRADGAGAPAGARREAGPAAGAGRHPLALAGRKPDLSMTTNGATFRLVAHELRARRPRPGQRLPRHPRSRPVRADDPPRRAAPRARRDRVGEGGRVLTRSRSTRWSSEGSTTTRSWRWPSSDGTTRCEVRFIEFMPLDAVRRLAGVGRRQPGRDRRPPSPPSTRSSRCRRGCGARRPLALPRRAG